MKMQHNVQMINEAFITNNSLLCLCACAGLKESHLLEESCCMALQVLGRLSLPKPLQMRLALM